MGTNQVAYKSPIRVIFEKFSRHKDVSLIYGEPIELDIKRVLPIAKVSYAVGGGGGYSGGSEGVSTGQGEGGGGHIVVKPVGVYEITPEKVTFKPVIEFRLVVLLVTVCTIGIVCLLRNKGSKN